jgi:two-component system LytT family response regulator
MGLAIMEKIKAVIIDDEELGRNLIREYLQSHPEVDIMDECQDAYQALESIDKFQPDLLFLDVQMPEVNGFELLEMLEEIPFVVFSTAYDKYALRAFEVNAVDYLLKPFDQERFDVALEKVKERIRHLQDQPVKIKNLLQYLQAEKPYLDKIMVKRSGKIVVLHVDEIQWVEAMGDYVNLHTAEGIYTVLQSMKHLEARLNPTRFIRVHRSSIVNLEAIKEIIPWTKGRFKVNLKDGQEIILSRSGASRLKKFML